VQGFVHFEAVAELLYELALEGVNGFCAAHNIQEEPQFALQVLSRQENGLRVSPDVGAHVLMFVEGGAFPEAPISQYLEVVSLGSFGLWFEYNPDLLVFGVQVEL
jgi:hypothetical protein